MGTRQLLSLAVLLGIWFLAFTEAAYKRDYGHHRGKKPRVEIARNPRASYPNRQPEIPALYSAPKPEKLQLEPDQSVNDVELSEALSTTTEIPYDSDQLVIDGAEDGAEIPEHDDEEGTSEDYQLQGAATEKSGALQEDPSFNEFPTLSSLIDDSSSYFRRKPVQNSYELSHGTESRFRGEERQSEVQNTREKTPSQYLPPVLSPATQRSSQSQSEYLPPSGSGYFGPTTQTPNNLNQQRLPDQQQIETKPFQNHVQIHSPTGSEDQGGHENGLETNLPSRQYLPQHERQRESQGGHNGNGFLGQVQPSQQLLQQSSGYSSSPSQNEIPNYSSHKKDESESLQLEGLSESIVDAELLQRVQQIIEEHEKQQKEFLEKQLRENDNAFSQTNRQSTTGGYSNDNNGRIPLQQAQHSPPSYFPDSNPSSAFTSATSLSPSTGSPHNFDSRSGNPRSFDGQQSYFQRQHQNQGQTQNNNQEPRPFTPVNVNGNGFGDFRQAQHQRNDAIVPTARQFDFGGFSQPQLGQPQGFSEEDARFSAAPVFRDVGNSIFSQDEPESRRGFQNGAEQRDEEGRTSKLNNYGIRSERPEGKSEPLKAEPEIEYQKAVLSTHFTETQPDPAFQAQQPNSREYLPPQARLHENSQFSSPSGNGESGSVGNSQHTTPNQVEHVNSGGFSFYPTERTPFPQPQSNFPTQVSQPSGSPSQPQLPLKNPNQPEFTSVNVNAGLIVTSRGQEVQRSNDDVVYGVPSTSFNLGRQENVEQSANSNFQPAHYPNAPPNREENFFRPQHIQTGNGEQSQYLPPLTAAGGPFRQETEQVDHIHSNPFTSHAPTTNNDDQTPVVHKSQEFPATNPQASLNNFIQNDPANSYGVTNTQPASYFQQEQPQQQQQPQVQSFFQQGRPGASFFNNNVQVATNDHENANNFFSEVNEIVKDVTQSQGQVEQDTIPRPLYGIPLAPVISIDSGEDFRGSQVDYSPAQSSSFFNDGESRENAQGFQSFQTTHTINNNYLTPQAVQTPFNGFPHQPQQQLFEQQPQPSPNVYATTPEQFTSADATNNRNDEQNGYGNSHNDNSAHLDQISLVSNAVSVPTRDYSPPTSYSYSSLSQSPATVSSTNSYGRIRRRISSPSSKH